MFSGYHNYSLKNIVMKKIILITLSILLSFSSMAQDKKKYDLSIHSKGASDNLSMSNNVSEMTLIKGGYFTIGTTQGVSTSNADDFNQITFGHPYALTSFPMIYADSSWVKPGVLFNNYTQILSQSQDTLSVFFTDSTRFEARFLMVQQNAGSSIKFIFRLKNIDVSSHLLGLGFTFDPSLGNNGDGYAMINSLFLQKDTVINSGVPSNFELWERDSYPKGIGIELAFLSVLPSELTLGNWNDMQDGALTTIQSLRWLYDLLMQAKWPTQTVNSNQQIEYSINLNFLQPEFSSDPFERWDMPSSLSLEDSVVFPLEQTTSAEVYNTQSVMSSNLSLQLLDSGMVDHWSSAGTFGVNGNDVRITEVPIVISEWFNDTIFDVYLKLKQNGVEKDLLKRRVYMPASPFSNTGLDVTIDSVSTANYPEVQVFFDAQNDITGQMLYKLKKVNIFPEEDNSGIQNFTLEKDTAGGVNQADIVIVLDVTGSMSNEIADVRDNVIEFADSLVQNGIDVRLGMVTFRDVVEDIFPLTNNIIGFQQDVSIQQAQDGDDEPENSLEALHSACQMIFRPEANRIFIWITDATYHIAPSPWTNFTVNDVVNELVANAVKVYTIGPAANQTQWYDQIVLNTGGDFYDINGNFRDVLLQISRTSGTNKYVMKYNSSAPLMQLHTIKVEVHYRGLGGYDIATVNFVNSPHLISYFPNPAKEMVQLNISNPDNKHCSILITDELGRKRKTLDVGNAAVINWNCFAADIGDDIIKPGMYLFHVMLTDNKNITETELVKIVFIN
jgi:Mg-chelatase subunit ChlD